MGVGGVHFLLHAKEDIYCIAVFEIEGGTYCDPIAVEAAMAWVGVCELKIVVLW